VQRPTLSGMTSGGTNLAAYRHVIWDWNGTLLDDAWLCIEITNQLLRKRGLALLTPERYQALFDFPVRDYYERVGFDLAAESFEALGTEFIHAYTRRRFECALQPGAVNALRAVRERQWSQSILSAYEHNRLVEIVRHFGLQSFFQSLNGIDDHYAGGKSGQGRALIGQLPYEPGQVLMIGDTVHDWEVAREMGTGCLLIPSGHHSREKLMRCGAPFVDSLQAWVDLLKGQPV